jgi:hypothetical protein
MTHQERLTALQHADELREEHWGGSVNGWIRLLPNKKVGLVGEKLVHAIVGGVHHRVNDLGYDIEVGDMMIEVKTSTLSYSAGNVWTWNQVRPNDPYTHLCFVAITPNDVRVFNVPRNEIPDVYLGQHGIGGDGGTTTQIKWNNRDTFPDWMIRHEIFP